MNTKQSTQYVCKTRQSLDHGFAGCRTCQRTGSVLSVVLKAGHFSHAPAQSLDLQRIKDMALEETH